VRVNSARFEIVEKRLGIPPDYQYKALNHSNFLQSNWHANKLTAVEYVIPNMNKTMRALDLGSGSGNFEFAFANKLNHIVAVDYHREALDFIKNVLIDKNISNVSLQYSDIRSLENKQDLGLFDLITLIDVIEHIRDAEAENMVSYLVKNLLYESP
jgi:2-polyprenyl-3-methyl-5-hydroxy-6-metoxy-1,4-benzoquinol methylase